MDLGERRVIILRYGPPWARPRFGYTVSDELLVSAAAGDALAEDAKLVHAGAFDEVDLEAAEARGSTGWLARTRQCSC
mgnify:CR=1 FL=1